MYYVSAQGVDERMINVHYYYQHATCVLQRFEPREELGKAVDWISVTTTLPRDDQQASDTVALPPSPCGCPWRCSHLKVKVQGFLSMQNDCRND